MAGIQTSLWLGAWYDPFGIVNYLEGMRFFGDGSIHWSYMVGANVLGATMFIGKSVLLVFVQIWLRWTLPRLRIDQVLFMCIKVLLPVAMLNLLGAAIYLWITDPVQAGGGLNENLVLFERIMRVVLAALGVLIAGGIGAIVAWAYIGRSKSTFKVIYPSQSDIGSLPGA